MPTGEGLSGLLTHGTLASLFFLYLSPPQISRLRICSSALNAIISSEEKLWETVVGRSHDGLARKLSQLDATDGSKVHNLVQAYRAAASIYSTRRVEWFRLRCYSSSGAKVDTPPQESHGSAMLFGGSTIAIVKGWGPPINNDIILCSTSNWGIGECVWVPLRSKHGSPHEGVYGHVVESLSEDSLAVFGGCRFGGYTGEVNTLRIVKVDQNNRTATWETPSCTGVPSSRAYCSMTKVQVGENEMLVLFGGMSQGFATNTIDLMDLGKHEWSKPTASGEPPCARFGHSATYFPKQNRLLISGGSNGSDLLRDGAEVRDIFFLSWTEESESPLELTWGKIATENRPPPVGLGRCHSAAKVSDSMVLFYGGSAQLSSSITMLDLKTMEFTLHDEIVRAGGGPCPRHAQVAALRGRYLMIYGGWCERSLKDLWVADLAGGTCSARRNALPYQAMDDEEWEEEDVNEFGACAQS
ncbi:unnamed protein product [Chrysoparadoxa australica]